MKKFSLKEISEKLKIKDSQLKKWVKIFKIGKKEKGKIYFDEKEVSKIKVIKELFKEGFRQRDIQKNLLKKMKEKENERKIKQSLKFLRSLYKELLEIKDILEK